MEKLVWFRGLWLFFLLVVTNAAPAAALSPEQTYLLGPRDVITLSIRAGGEEQYKGDLTVSAEGKINVPFLGPMDAEGLSTPRLEAAISEILARDYFVDPAVNIHIKEYHSLRYYIVGAIKNPGLYEMASSANLMQLIATAGGVDLDRANVAYILRDAVGQADIIEEEEVEALMARNEPLKVDLKGLLDKGDLRHNVQLRTGDVVYIPFKKSQDVAASNIYVDGEVNSPGVYPFQPGLTAMNACLMAGGFGKYAAPNRTRVIRKKGEEKEIIEIDLNAVKRGEAADLELMPGDLIHVPETWL